MTDQETGAPPPDPNTPAQSSQAPAPGPEPESDQQENDPRGEGIEGGSAPTAPVEDDEEEDSE